MNLYILWFQGLKQAPDVVKWCVYSWKHYNPTWNIIFLDNDNLHQYVDIKKLTYDKDIELCHLADMIRMILLRDHGGLWVDATSFCNKPLNEWFLPYMAEGFFAFDRYRPDLMIANWFLYAEKNHPLLSQWCEETLYYYQVHGKASTYFIHHQLFQSLYEMDIIFQGQWDKVPKLSGSIPHTLQIVDFFKTNGQKDIDSKRVPVYKLSYKCTFPPYDPRMNVYYLYSTL